MDRTGSTLTREILNCSDAIGLAGEPQYFRRRPHGSFFPDGGHRALIKKIGDISTEDGAKKVIDYLFLDPEHFSYFWRFSWNGFDREEFLRKFLSSDRSERALLDLALAFHARGKPIRGDKTPANIFFVPTIMKWFPNAKIVHTFRDPRAIYVSRNNKKEKKPLNGLSQKIRKSGIVFELYAGSRVVLDWKRIIHLHRQYQENYPGSYYLSKYEDLISDPENSIRNLCNFLEVDCVDEMYRQTVVNSSFVPKDQLKKGFDYSAIDRWRKHINPLIYKWINLSTKKQLLEFDYTR
jgi:hypothetical protein